MCIHVRHPVSMNITLFISISELLAYRFFASLMCSWRKCRRELLSEIFICSCVTAWSCLCKNATWAVNVRTVVGYGVYLIYHYMRKCLMFLDSYMYMCLQRQCHVHVHVYVVSTTFTTDKMHCDIKQHRQEGEMRLAGAQSITTTEEWVVPPTTQPTSTTP